MGEQSNFRAVIERVANGWTGHITDPIEAVVIGDTYEAIVDTVRGYVDDDGPDEQGGSDEGSDT